MEIGKRLIYNTETGFVLNNHLEEMSGELKDGLRFTSINYIDLPYGYNENNFKQAVMYHIDISKLNTNDLTQIIVIDEYSSTVTAQ